MKHRHYSALAVLSLLLFYSSISVSATNGFKTVTDSQWNETAVRKVLHSFAYGGHTSDAQIRFWAELPPEVAIREMLDLAPFNPWLSPPEDNTHMHAQSLKSMQDFWSSADAGNPVRPDKRRHYSTLYTLADGTTTNLSTANMQRTWIQAVTTRGTNPFRHKLGLYLTNYHMAIHVNKTRAALMRDFYDSSLDTLEQTSLGIGNFFTVLANGAKSAAVARAYGHQYNRYNNNISRFYGNDDFAREFHQLFFKIQGTSETGTTEHPGQDYHENVTIEHTAWLLTGMNLDRAYDAYGSTDPNDWLLFPIDFTDHVDSTTVTDRNGNQVPRRINNYTNHHHACLEILNSAYATDNICGATAEEKLLQLAQVAGYNDESLDNMPVAIIDFFADDNLTQQKRDVIRSAWRNQEPKNLLQFLRSYAISSTFHRRDTYKFRSAFDRNLIVQNMNTFDNQETFARFQLPQNQMRVEGVEVFRPEHDVFGGQTGLQAANNPNIFKEAFKRSVMNPYFLADTEEVYTDASSVQQTWLKDWARIIPADATGNYPVSYVTNWLWNRFIADNGRNLDYQARLQLHAILASGRDFGYQSNSTAPGLTYSESEITADATLLALTVANQDAQMNLSSVDAAQRKEANRRVGMAVNFITVTPYMFALEGK